MRTFLVRVRLLSSSLLVLLFLLVVVVIVVVVIVVVVVAGVLRVCAVCSVLCVCLYLFVSVCVNSKATQWQKMVKVARASVV